MIRLLFVNIMRGCFGVLPFRSFITEHEGRIIWYAGRKSRLSSRSKIREVTACLRRNFLPVANGRYV